MNGPVQTPRLPELWAQFIDRGLGATIRDDQIGELRKAFFGGAGSVLSIILAAQEFTGPELRELYAEMLRDLQAAGYTIKIKE
jgi:hypothetical protein